MNEWGEEKERGGQRSEENSKTSPGVTQEERKKVQEKG